MKDYLTLISKHGININFNEATVHIWTTGAKLAFQNNSTTIKLKDADYDKDKALKLAIDKLLEGL